MIVVKMRNVMMIVIIILMMIMLTGEWSVDGMVSCWHKMKRVMMTIDGATKSYHPHHSHHDDDDQEWLVSW